MISEETDASALTRYSAFAKGRLVGRPTDQNGYIATLQALPYSRSWRRALCRRR